MWSVWAGFVLPLFDYIAEAEGNIDRSRTMIEHYRSAEDSEVSLRNRLVLVRAVIPAEELLGGATAAQIDADLQARIQGLISESGAQPIDTKTLPHATEGAFTRYGIEMELRATTLQLVTILHRVEAEKPALFVDHLTVRVSESGDGLSGSNAESLLNVQLRLAGFTKLPQLKSTGG